MPSSFPGAIDSFTDPLSNSPLNSPSHSAQHADLNDAAEKLETYMGLVKVIPTSVSSAGGTSATLGATGTVTVGSANTSVTVNGAFSSLYDNYRILYTGGTKTADGTILMSLGGITTGYYQSFIYGSYTGTTVTNYGLNNGSSWTDIGGGYSGAALVDVTLYGPNLVLATNGFAVVRYSTFWGTATMLNTNTTQATAFTLTNGSGTMTGGTITVYGFRK